ncbi:PadR family transcriptional regulator [Leifsonia sp. NPDC058230]|uniref:PadR family transcriptional regulator n=1 Tax=Leifsonia sp. NPDC058230 TaxID=3346391 RepID=UPI0036D7F288
MADTSMREPTFWILTALSTGRRHGYALIHEVQQLSHGRVDLKVATLYAALDRLSRQDLVVPDGDEVIDGRFRRFFRLSPAGRSALTAEIERMEQNARDARARLALAPRTPQAGFGA